MIYLMGKPTFWTKDKKDHCVSPSRLFSIAPKVLGIFNDIPDHVMRYIRSYGEKIEQAFVLHFEADVPLRECVDDDDYLFYPQWQILLDWLAEKKFTPIIYEKSVLDYEKLISGSVDLVCKDKDGDLVYIELKTRNLLTTEIKDADLLQLLFYMEAHNVNQGYVIAIHRKKKEPAILTERLFRNMDGNKYEILKKKLVLAKNYYNEFFRDEVNKKWAIKDEIEIEYTNLKAKKLKGVYYGKQK